MDKVCGANNTFTDGSCIDLDILIIIAEEYNKNNPSSPISLDNNKVLTNSHKYKRYLVDELTTRFKNICPNQECWLKKLNAKNNPKINKLRKRINTTFAPNGPSGQFTWLNTFNINDVLEMYEVKYPEFKSLGAVPIDFYEINYNEIANIDFYELYKTQGITKLGIVFNLDTHDMSGSHWIALYCELTPNPRIYFFDSYASKPNERVQKFIKLLKGVCKKINGEKEIIMDYNKKPHQKGGSECGMYSLYFIINMLEGTKTFEDINKIRIPDEEVNKYRCKYLKSKWCLKNIA